MHVFDVTQAPNTSNASMTSCRRNVQIEGAQVHINALRGRIVLSSVSDDVGPMGGSGGTIVAV